MSYHMPANSRREPLQCHSCTLLTSQHKVILDATIEWCCYAGKPPVSLQFGRECPESPRPSVRGHGETTDALSHAAAAQHGPLHPPSSATQSRGMNPRSFGHATRAIKSGPRMQLQGEAYDANLLPIPAPSTLAGSGLPEGSCGMGPYLEDPLEGLYLENPREGPYLKTPWEGPHLDNPQEGPYPKNPWEGPCPQNPYLQDPCDGPYLEDPWEGAYLEQPWEGPWGFPGAQTHREVPPKGPWPISLGKMGSPAHGDWPWPNTPAPVYCKQCSHTPCTHTARAPFPIHCCTLCG